MQLSTPLFDQLAEFIKTNPTNEETQRKIEEKLRQDYFDLTGKVEGERLIDYSLISHEFNKLLIECSLELKLVVGGFIKSYKDYKHPNTKKVKYELELHKILTTVCLGKRVGN